MNELLFVLDLLAKNVGWNSEDGRGRDARKVFLRKDDTHCFLFIRIDSVMITGGERRTRAFLSRGVRVEMDTISACHANGCVRFVNR